MEQALKDGAEALNARAQKEQAELKKQVQDLEARYDPASEEYEKGYRTLQLRLAELDFDLKREGQRLQERRSRNLANLYKEIAAEAERIAVEKGITCVLIRDGEDVQVEDQGKVLSAEAVRQQMILRTVLWADPALDLTKEVLAALQK
jgi:Skp family chaperone for outer membrane proteins